MKQTNTTVENLSYSIICVLFVWHVYALATKGFPEQWNIKPSIVDLGFFALFVFVVYMGSFLASFSFTNPMLRVGVFLWLVGAVIYSSAMTFKYFIGMILLDHSLTVVKVAIMLNILFSCMALLIFLKARLKR
jgi:hypothetical protein